MIKPTVDFNIKSDKTALLAKNAGVLKSKMLLVGIPETETSRQDGENVSNAFLGYLHENGSPARKIPPRPFLAPSIEKNKDVLSKILGADVGKNLLSRNFNEKAFLRAGLKAQSIVKNYIIKGENFAPLSKKTLEKRAERGFTGTKPLIETAQLLNSINFVIR